MECPLEGECPHCVCWFNDMGCCWCEDEVEDDERG